MKSRIRRLIRFFHPNIAEGITGVGYAILCVVLLVAFAGQASGTNRRVADIAGAIIHPTYLYNPPESEFHLTGVRYVIHSYYLWDSGVLGSAAVDDIDMMLPAWTHEAARLPGQSWATYHYVGSGWIPGSGGYIVFSTPNGGRIAYFHLTHFRWTTVMHGGQRVGTTGWPTSTVFAGGGPADGSDAHLCIAPDARGLRWLEYGVFHEPHPFHHKVWNQARLAKHLQVIPYKHAGKLTRAAKVWNYHYKRLGGVLHRAHYFHPKGQHWFWKNSYQGGAIFVHQYGKPTIRYWRHRQPLVVAATALSRCEAGQGGCVRALLTVINHDRALNGAAPLTLSWPQSRCSKVHSAHMADLGALTHDQFPNDICVPYRTAGENVGLAATGSTWIDLQTMNVEMLSEPWSPGCTDNHVCNLRNPAYHIIGIGIVRRNGETWLTEDMTG